MSPNSEQLLAAIAAAFSQGPGGASVELAPYKGKYKQVSGWGQNFNIADRGATEPAGVPAENTEAAMSGLDVAGVGQDPLELPAERPATMPHMQPGITGASAPQMQPGGSGKMELLRDIAKIIMGGLSGMQQAGR